MIEVIEMMYPMSIEVGDTSKQSMATASSKD